MAIRCMIWQNVEDEDCHFDVLEPSKEIDIVFTKTKQNKRHGFNWGYFLRFGDRRMKEREMGGVAMCTAQCFDGGGCCMLSLLLACNLCFYWQAILIWLLDWIGSDFVSSPVSRCLGRGKGTDPRQINNDAREWARGCTWSANFF